MLVVEDRERVGGHREVLDYRIAASFGVADCRHGHLKHVGQSEVVSFEALDGRLGDDGEGTRDRHAGLAG